MKEILLIFSLLIPVLSFSQSSTVTVTEVQDLLESGAMLVDVRENEEVAEVAFELDRMMHLPLSELKERYRELPTDITLIMACRSGNRSAKAIAQLTALKVSNTVNMEGGIKSWQESGFPVIENEIELGNKACCSKKSSEEKSCCSNASKKKVSTENAVKLCCSKEKS